jgi:hypothetical protein
VAVRLLEKDVLPTLMELTKIRRGFFHLSGS